MYHILCFGDSNTWGYIPASGERFSTTQRWTGLLQSLGKTRYQILEEGLNGRTTIDYDEIREQASGLDDLPAILPQYPIIDAAIVMLGTNDLKARFDLSATEIAAAAAKVGQAIKQSAVIDTDVKVILVAPPVVNQIPAEWAEEFKGAELKSAGFSAAFEKQAELAGFFFLDAARFVTSSPVDGFHWDARGHAGFARAVLEKLDSIFLENQSGLP